MPDILHEFPVLAPLDRVLAAVRTPAGLDRWWTLTAAGEPTVGATYELGFGPEWQWRARVTRADDRVFELEMTEAVPDWLGTRVRFELEAVGPEVTQVRFAHEGWADASQHYRVSSFCWACYLRLLRRAVERGEVVPYEQRLDA